MHGGAGKMKMKMARVILFTAQMDKMTAFYRDVMGLKQVTDDPGWREFEAGSVTIALHSGPPSPGKKGPKIVFFARDVAAGRAALVARGAKPGVCGRIPAMQRQGPGPQSGAAVEPVGSVRFKNASP